MTDDPSPLAAAALARNDRYLREFIEALNICPYARTCREAGRLHREVLEQEAPEPAPVVARIHALESGPDDAVDVGLLIFPALRLEPRPFEAFVRAVRQGYEKDRKRLVTFFMVGFHPEMVMDLTNADRAVSFMRRSPDPTIQLVSVRALDRAHEGAGDRRHLSEVIAAAGLAAVQKAGPEQLAAALAALAALRSAPA